MISRFFERNKPIFIIGTAFLMMFLLIIIFYKAKPHKETGMSKVTDDNYYKVQEEYERQEYYGDKINNETGINQEGTQQTQNESLTAEMSIDEKYGILEIEYTENGFKPRLTKTIQGRAVRWTNKTDRTIYFHQRKETYDELKQLVEIKPGESFNFRLSELGIWTYEENESKHFGSIEVTKFP